LDDHPASGNGDPSPRWLRPTERQGREPDGRLEAGEDWLSARRPDPRGRVPTERVGTVEPAIRRFSRPSYRATAAPPHFWRNVALGLGLLFSILLGATGSLVYGALTRSSGGAPPVAAATSTASPTPAPATASPARATPSGSVSPDQSPGPSDEPTMSPSPTATAVPESTGPVLAASITFYSLMLDSASDPAATKRTFQFTTDGPGAVSVQVSGATPAANSKLCLKANSGADNCTTGATPGFYTVAPAGNHATWTVTLIAPDPGSPPAVDLTINWRTHTPAITLVHGRFQGSPNPDSMRGLRATFQALAPGNLAVTASWAPLTTDVTVTLRDVTVAPGTAVDDANYMAVQSIRLPYSHPVTTGNKYEVSLLNVEADSGRPDLTATIAFP
jgi:hypothetical protein